MESWLTYLVFAALAVHIGMILVGVYKVWRGENMIDRLIGLDVVSTLVLAVLILVAIVERSAAYIDVALGLAALSYIATLALAKYISDQRVF